MHAPMRPFQERNLTLIGGCGLCVVVTLAAGALNYNRLPFLSSGDRYTAYFDEVGGLTVGAPVEVSGFSAGQVKDITLEPQGALITFTVADDIRLGTQTEAAIRTTSLLGTKVLSVRPRGEGRLSDSIPLDRTTSPYQLPDALGDLTKTISGLDTSQLSTALQTLSQTLSDTPVELKSAVDGVARFTDTIDRRDAQLRALLSNANKATTVLAQRSDQVVALIRDTNEVLAALRSQNTALEGISGHVSELAKQIRGFIDDNHVALKPSLEKLNGVLATLDNRRTEIQQSIKGISTYAMSLGEALASGPFFKAYVANLIPGQILQPFIDAAFSDLGLDPNVLLPSQRTDPQTGQPGTPALPAPFPRTGQGGEPRMTLPDAITGKPGDPRYPYREPLPAPPPGGPPPGPPALPPGQDSPAAPAPNTVFVPAPAETPSPNSGAHR